MKICTEIEIVNNLLLSKYKGIRVQVWMFSISHRRMALRLKKTEFESDVAYLIGLNCDYITGPFSWENSNIFICNKEVDTISTIEAVIEDEGSGFKLTASGGFTFAEGLEEEFGNSFENFII